MRNTNIKNNNFDFSLLIIIFLLMIISCVAIYSSQKYLPYHQNFSLRQAIYFVVGLIITIVIYFLDFEQIKKISIFTYIFGVLILTILLLSPPKIAPVIKGAKSWFVIPGFSIQPSEFMKVFLILFLARIIVDHNEKYIERTIKYDMLLIFKIGIATAVPLGLILLQPDAGTAMVITIITVGMLFLSGINWRIFFILFSLATLILGTLVYIYLLNPDLLLNFLDQYQLDRINSWLNPFKYGDNIGFQLRNSILAIGSGMMHGKGFKRGEVYIPEAHSDFIFSTIGEEFGFIGSSIVIGLYFFLIYKIVVIALENKGQYENLIAAGVISMLTFHIFENIGMVIGVVPITGIPLPLLSYGGSSVIGTLFALSIILNISAKTRKYMFGSNQ